MIPCIVCGDGTNGVKDKKGRYWTNVCGMCWHFKVFKEELKHAIRYTTGEDGRVATVTLEKIP